MPAQYETRLGLILVSAVAQDLASSLIFSLLLDRSTCIEMRKFCSDIIGISCDIISDHS